MEGSDDGELVLLVKSLCLITEVVSLIPVFLFCWLPYAIFSLVAIFGWAEVGIIRKVEHTSI